MIQFKKYILLFLILCYNIFGDYVKRCAVIYNPNSGKGLMLGHLDEFRDILLDNNYETDFFKTEYHKHAIEIIENLNFKTIISW